MKSFALALCFVALSRLTPAQNQSLGISETPASAKALESKDFQEAIQREEAIHNKLDESLEESAKKAQRDLRLAATPTEEALAQWQIQIEKSKSELLDQRKGLLDAYQKRSLDYQHVEDQITSWKKLQAENRFLSSWSKLYPDVDAAWQRLIIESFDVYQVQPGKPQIPLEIPSLGDDLVDTLNPEQKELIGQGQKELQTLATELQKGHSQIRELSLRKHYELLKKVGDLRSSLIKYGFDNRKFREVNPGFDFWSGVRRELQFMPHRAVAILLTKVSGLREKFSLGWRGALNLTQEFLALVLLALSLYFVRFVFKSGPKLLERIRIHLFQERKHSPLKAKLAPWIPRLSPFLPWAVLWLMIPSFQSLLEKSLFSEIAALLPFLEYFVGYQVLRIFSSDLLFTISGHFRLSGALSSQHQRDKIEKTAKHLALACFIILTLLYTVESMANRGLVYYLFREASIILGLIYLVLNFRHWTREILFGLEEHKHSVISRYTAKILKSRIGWTLNALGILWLFLLFCFNALQNSLMQLDFVKKISAQIFRKRLEESSDYMNSSSEAPPPEEYCSLFRFGVPDNPDLILQPDSAVFKKVQNHLKEWVDGVDVDRQVMISGAKGSGKSTLLKLLELTHQKDIAVVLESVPPKITKASEAKEFLDRIKGRLKENAKDTSKALVLLDECQNLFVAKVGGFRAYKSFLSQILDNEQEDILWVCAFNKQAWDYIDCVFRKEIFLPSTYELHGWSVEDLSNLIMSRHKKSRFRLYYDPIIRAATRGEAKHDFAAIESKILQLIWEQSDGNPRAALYYWLSALSPYASDRLKVGLPEDDAIALEFLTEEQLFILASIVKHENLSSGEIAQVTDYSLGSVKRALGSAIDRGLVEKDSYLRYRVTPEVQASLLKSLKAKNLIYG